MILMAFDVKFLGKKDEIPSRACNPSYTFIYSIQKMKTNKFTKSPSSRAGIPIVRFLMHLEIIKHQKSTLEIATQPK